MIRLTPEVIQHIKQTPSLKLRLMAAAGINSNNTMAKCLDENDIRLTALDTINIIVDDMGLPLSEIIQGGKVSKLLSQ